MYSVYHIGISDDIRQGYIGVTVNLKRRWKQHRTGRTGKRIQCALKKYPDAKYKCIAKGLTKNEAYLLESKLRPEPFMGWNISAGGNAGFVWHKSYPGYHEWTTKLKARRVGKQPALGMKHSEETKIICGKHGAKRWDNKRASDKWEDHMFDCGSPKIALELYGIPRTTYYRERKRLGLVNDEKTSKNKNKLFQTDKD
jgi:predicted GIY-YIG superfamily endonuclease